MMIIFRLIFALMASLLLAGTAQAAPRVVVSIAPVHSITASVMKGVGEPQLLLGKNISPHEFSLKPSQARMLQKADLVIWVGPLIETPLQAPLATLAKKAEVYSLTDAVYGGATPDARYAHLWLDTHNAVLMADLIAKKLASLDQTHKAQYLDNAEQFKQSMVLLEKKIAALLKPVQQKPFMAFHDAFAPFVRRFNLNSAGAVRINHAVKPGAGAIRRLRKEIAEKQIACLTGEYGEENPLIDTLLDGTKTKTVALDPLGARFEPGEELYPRTMEKLAGDLALCLK